MSASGETEGVIKYHLAYKDGPLEDYDLGPLDHWHGRLKAAGLIGQDPARYDGYGFGNLSERVEGGFLITGTQTGHLPRLGLADYALVTRWDVAANRIWARGETRPSSEALSHAAVYVARPDARFVFHVHSTDLWQSRAALGLAETGADVPYGTPQMAADVARLLEDPSVQIFAMAGHEDGIIALGRTADEAGEMILAALGDLQSSKPSS